MILTFVVSSIADGVALPLREYRIDLFVHLIEYGLLAWLIFKYLERAGSIEKNRFILWLPVLVCAVIGGANELWQIHVPGRYASVSDELANIAGSLIVLIWFKLKLNTR